MTRIHAKHKGVTHKPIGSWQSFTLPEPPSANRWWRKFNNRMVLSPEARKYKAMVAGYQLRSDTQFHRFDFPTTITVTVVWYRSRKSGDLDKRLGVLLDALQGVAYDNDNQIVELYAIRSDDDHKNPRVEVTVMEAV